MQEEASSLPDSAQTNMYLGLCFFTICVLLFLMFFSYKNKGNRVVLLIAKKLNSLTGNILLVMLGVVWASIVSVFSSEIKYQIKNGLDLEFFLFLLFISLFILGNFFIKIFNDYESSGIKKLPSFSAVVENKYQSINMINLLTNIIFHYKNIENNNSSRELFEKTLDESLHVAIESILKVTYKLTEHDSSVKIKCNIFNLLSSDGITKYYKNLNKDESSFSSTESESENEIFDINSIGVSPFFLKSNEYEEDVLYILNGCDFILMCERGFSKEVKNKDTIQRKDPVSGDGSPLAMPVTFFHIGCQKSKYHPNIFGAPEAVLNDKIIYIANIKDTVDGFIADIKKSKLHGKLINDYYIDQIQSYYQEDKDKPLSIISIPIRKQNDLFDNICPSNGKAQGDCVSKMVTTPERIDTGESGEKQNSTIPQTKQNEIQNDSRKDNCCAYVLNIYINRCDFFENNEQQQGFGHLIAPMVHTLSCLMTLKSVYSIRMKAQQSVKEDAKENSNG